MSMDINITFPACPSNVVPTQQYISLSLEMPGFSAVIVGGKKLLQFEDFANGIQTAQTNWYNYSESLQSFIFVLLKYGNVLFFNIFKEIFV